MNTSEFNFNNISRERNDAISEAPQPDDEKDSNPLSPIHRRPKDSANSNAKRNQRLAKAHQSTAGRPSLSEAVQYESDDNAEVDEGTASAERELEKMREHIRGVFGALASVNDKACALNAESGSDDGLSKVPINLFKYNSNEDGDVAEYDECYENPDFEFDVEQKEEEKVSDQKLEEQRRDIDKQYSKDISYATNGNSYVSVLTEIRADDKASTEDVQHALGLLKSIVQDMDNASSWCTIDCTDDNFAKYLFGNPTRVRFLELLGYYFDEQDPTQMTCNEVPPKVLRDMIAGLLDKAYDEIPMKW